VPDSVDLDGDVDMERDGEEEDDEKEDEVVDEDEEEDEDDDEDNGKEPQMICDGEMVNTSPDDAHTVVDDEPTMLPKQGQEIREHTPRPLRTLPAPRPPTPEPYSRPRTPGTLTIPGLKVLGLVRP